MRCIARSHRLARGVSLIEAVIVVVVLAISIPPTVAWMSNTSAHQADAVNTTRAGVLAQAVIEQIMADVRSTSPGLGFAALGDVTAYLDTPTTGLRARLAPVSDLYTNMGMTFEVGVSELVSPNGAATGDTRRDVCRRVEVVVKFRSAVGPERTLTVNALVTSP